MSKVPTAKSSGSVQDSKFEEWALLELFGHQRLAGMVSEIQLGGASFVRVDVPADSKSAPAKLTRMYNPSAIYSITPVTEETARMLAKNISGEPVTRWDVQEMVAQAKKQLRPAAVDEEEYA